MAVLSVPLSAELENAVQNLITADYGRNKADVVRRAILKTAEDEALKLLMESKQAIKKGEVIEGDLEELMKVF